MDKFLSAVVLFMMPAWALAAMNETAADAPAELVDVMYVVVFGVLFIGMIVGFFVYFWWVERKKKKAGQ